VSKKCPKGTNNLSDKGLGTSPNGVYQCLTLNVQFDTYSVNEMQITVVAANATTDNSEIVRRTANERQKKKVDGYFIDYPPPAYPPFWSEGVPTDKSAGTAPRTDTPQNGPSEEIAVSENNEGDSESGVVTLHDILDYWTAKKNLFSNSRGYSIEFELGGEPRTTVFAQNSFSTNAVFVRHFSNHWLEMHQNLQ
jgi:hypothetical protein